MRKPECPKCRCTSLKVERRPNGDAECCHCGWKGDYSDCFKYVPVPGVEDIRKNKPHCVLLAMCLEPRWKPVKTGPVASAFLPCHKRWLAILEPGTNLLKLECPECGAQNSFASVLPTDYSQVGEDHG